MKKNTLYILVLIHVTVFGTLSAVSGFSTHWCSNKIVLGTFIVDACTSYQATCSACQCIQLPLLQKLIP